MRIKNFLLFIIAVVVLAGCGKVTYRKSPGGMPYKVYSGNDTQKIYTGNFLKVHFTRLIKDSVEYTSVGSMPVYIPVSETATPYDITEIWTKLKRGDSVVATQMMDTFIKRNPQHPSFLNGQYKKGDRITITVKILDVFTSDSALKVDEAKEKLVWESQEEAKVIKYIADNKIKAEKLPSGVYLEMIEAGTGNSIDSGKFISINYSGTTFAGKKFDSNTDSAFGHVAPLTFTVGNQEMIKGLDEGVRSMRKGTHARLYIPSALGYGAQPDPRSGIKPYDNLIFDIVVLDVLDKAPPLPKRPNVNMPQQPE